MHDVVHAWITWLHDDGDDDDDDDNGDDDDHQTSRIVHA